MSSSNNTALAATGTNKKRTVMVTGANGYLASHIVQDLLEQGHTVHACVRDASHNVEHLQALAATTTTNAAAEQRFQLFSTGDLATVADRNGFEIPMQGCDAIIHTATPLNVKFGEEYNGEEQIYKPAMTSTQELLRCIEKQNNNTTIKCLVLTSSMAAVAPRPEPRIKDESHWSDATSQRQRDNWYGCTKTSQEQLVRDWVRNAKKEGILSNDFVYAAICPTMVIGPPVPKPGQQQQKPDNHNIGGTMGKLLEWFQTARNGEAPNDSMSFIHVQDCAKMHTQILSKTTSADEINSHQRYMSLIESLHWNDILKLMKELYPSLPHYKPYDGSDIVTPTQFNLDNMKSLGVNLRSTRQAMQDSLDYFKQMGVLKDES